MKKIYLHIGLHKTGSTSLQQFTRKNHDLFGELGLYVPPPFRPKSNNPGVSLGSSKGGLHAIPRSISSGQTEVLDAFLDEFEKSGLDKALLSSEGFDAFTRKEINFLASQLKSYQVHPVLVLRHPVLLARSIYCSLGRISPVQGNKLIDPRAFLSHPGHLLSKIWVSKKRTQKISNTNYIIRQTSRRIYDFQGICRDWSSLARVKVLLFEQSNDIAKDILSYVFQDNPDSLDALAGMDIPRLRGSLPVPMAVMNNELYNSLNIDKKVYQRHVYPNLVKFSKSKKYKKIISEDNNNYFPFSSRDQDLLLKKIRSRLDPKHILAFIECQEDEKEVILSGLEYYKQSMDGCVVPNQLIKQIKEQFIKFCMKPAQLSL